MNCNSTENRKQVTTLADQIVTLRCKTLIECRPTNKLKIYQDSLLATYHSRCLDCLCRLRCRAPLAKVSKNMSEIHQKSWCGGNSSTLGAVTVTKQKLCYEKNETLRLQAYFSSVLQNPIINLDVSFRK